MSTIGSNTAKKRARALFIAVIALGCGGAAVGCDDVITDPTFRTWCGEQLCTWKVEAGSIRRAPTWHKKDYGVELLEAPTVLSQETSQSPRCLEFTMVANVAPEAQVTIGVDFNRDGTIDYEQPIAATGFREAKTQVTPPIRYDGIRFVITKKGAGTAVLSQMRARTPDTCSAPPLALQGLPIGSVCSLAGGGDECSSGVCCDGLCAECCQGPPVGEKVPAGVTANNPVVACPGGGTCERAANGTRDFIMPSVPLQCDPGKGRKSAGAECLVDADCASLLCEGARIEAAGAGAGGGCAESFDAGPGCNVSLTRGGRCR